MLNFYAFFSGLLRRHKPGVLSLTQTDSDNLVIGSSRSGRKSDMTLKIEATAPVQVRRWRWTNKNRCAF